MFLTYQYEIWRADKFENRWDRPFQWLNKWYSLAYSNPHKRFGVDALGQRWLEADQRNLVEEPCYPDIHKEFFLQYIDESTLFSHTGVLSQECLRYPQPFGRWYIPAWKSTRLMDEASNHTRNESHSALKHNPHYQNWYTKFWVKKIIFQNPVEGLFLPVKGHTRWISWHHVPYSEIRDLLTHARKPRALHGDEWHPF